MRITVPEALTESHVKYDGEAGRAWSAGLPALGERYLEEWGLRLDGEPGHGVVSLVLPVVREDGTQAALKLQPVTDENASEAIGLRAWDGDASVRLLESDPETGTMLLERLHAGRPLSAVPDDVEAMTILTELLVRLVAHPAPEGMRRLEDIAQAMLDDVDEAIKALPRERDRFWLRWCADAVAELVPEPGDRLLHWDLHYDNVLAGDREPWLAIDPKPLAGDPGFDLWPALWNRWDDVVATGDMTRAVLRRFDQMVDGLGLDPQRAAGWTLGRVLQNGLWNVEDGESELGEIDLIVAEAVRHRQRG
ncbi:aminoglycoside phosphotransferase family protein [Nonomuraea basaltis]|uniref:aminoglycoside phosphotransferase family protein n=1 Tax=Nonomuraea basaltis TaxID=2495887 RepID=UPI00110C4591|nr:aminoglycoside phosphotransferase family protein [Nonomuraea basaltis]TMS00478.1 hydroxyurea phosphotransferase [Nonomuraea basaltis]